MLLADLVFLQTAWTLLNLGAGWWLKRVDRDGTAGYCEGCATRWTTGTAGTAGAEVDGAYVKRLASTLEGSEELDIDSLDVTPKDGESVVVNVREKGRSGSPEGVEQSIPLLPEASAHCSNLDMSDEER